MVAPLHADDDDFVPDQVVVRLDIAAGVTIEAIHATYGTSTLDMILGSSGIYLLQIAPGQSVASTVQAMRNDPRLLYAEPNFVSEAPVGDPSGTWAWGGMDPAPYLGQYAAGMLNLAAAHAETSGEGVTIAVLDTGVQLDHPQLAGRLSTARYDFIDDDATPEDEANGLDDNGDGRIDEGYGHGTHVAGIANLVAPESQLMPLRVLDSDGTGNDFLLAEAILFAVQHGAHVINLSLGTSSESELLEDVIERATTAGVTVVAAAGNDDSSTEQYPAADANALAVTAVGPTQLKSAFANYGEWIDIAAPGEAIVSTFPEDGYAQWRGTSMATGFISGQVALLHSLHPGASVAELSLLVRASAQPLDTLNPSYGGLLGAGLADVGRSLSQSPDDGYAHVHCGQVLSASVIVINDLLDCPGDGLVMGADGITIDLNGRTIDGVGVGSGIRNSGFSGVSVRNGVVREFDYGVELDGTSGGGVTALTLQLNQDAEILMHNGASGALAKDNTMSGSPGVGIYLQNAVNNHVEANTISGASNTGILLEGASQNIVVRNAVTNSSDTAIALVAGSDGNRLEGNTVAESGDAGIFLSESMANVLVANTVQQAGDSGIFLQNAHNNLLAGNDLRFNAGGIELDTSSANLLESNDASDSAGTGIEIVDESLANVLRLNVASRNQGRGIVVMAEVPSSSALAGNLLDGNTALSNSSDGIYVVKAGHALTANTANDNGAWGIYMEPGNSATNNVATGNVKAEQCYNLTCSAEPPPEEDPPPGEDPPPDEDPPPGEDPAPDCTAQVTLVASADAWLEQNSPSNNKGHDAVLKVKSQSSNDNFRALLQFPAPDVPAGCVVESATLRLYAASWKSRRTLQAQALAGAWSEYGVTWSNQPSTMGMTATTASGSGYREWDVTDQAQTMVDLNAWYGFLIRDASEKGSGAEQQFHSREKGEQPPQLIITLAAAAD